MNALYRHEKIEQPERGEGVREMPTKEYIEKSLKEDELQAHRNVIVIIGNMLRKELFSHIGSGDMTREVITKQKLRELEDIIDVLNLHEAISHPETGMAMEINEGVKETVGEKTWKRALELYRGLGFTDEETSIRIHTLIIAYLHLGLSDKQIKKWIELLIDEREQVIPDTRAFLLNTSAGTKMSMTEEIDKLISIEGASEVFKKLGLMDEPTSSQIRRLTTSYKSLGPSDKHLWSNILIESVRAKTGFTLSITALNLLANELGQRPTTKVVGLRSQDAQRKR